MIERRCVYAAQIPDDAFDMCEDYPNGRYVCFVCYRKALVRRGLALDQTKYIDAAILRLISPVTIDPLMKFRSTASRLARDWISELAEL